MYVDTVGESLLMLQMCVQLKFTYETKNTYIYTPGKNNSSKTENYGENDISFGMKITFLT